MRNYLLSINKVKAVIDVILQILVETKENTLFLYLTY